MSRRVFRRGAVVNRSLMSARASDSLETPLACTLGWPHAGTRVSSISLAAYPAPFK